jgi:hypothetical protein
MNLFKDSVWTGPSPSDYCMGPIGKESIICKRFRSSFIEAWTNPIGQKQINVKQLQAVTSTYICFPIIKLAYERQPQGAHA